MSGPLSSFVSPLALDCIDDDFTSDALVREFEAATAVIDIKGFTTLADRLSRRGPAGLEELASLADECFGNLVQAIHESGGFVHAFPGDAAIAIWPAGVLSLRDVTSVALRCAHELTKETATRRLSLKAGIGVGRITSVALGGVRGRYEALATGDPFTQAGLAVARAEQGAVVLGPMAAELLGMPNSLGATDDYATRSSAAARSSGVQRRLTPPLDRKQLEVLRTFMLEGLPERIESGEETWVGAIRKLSVVFVRIASPDGQPLLVSRIQLAFREMQSAFYELQGTIVQVCHDDKGVVVLGALGLPGSHEDDPERAVRVALDLERRLKSVGVASSIGVATGRLVCRLLGGQYRREYRIVGSVANLASRLMEAAADGTLCDQATLSDAPGVAFAQPFSLSVKGVSFPVIAARPQRVTGYRPRRITGAPVDAERPSSPAIYGRDREVHALEAWLSATTTSRGTLLLRGEAGIGKSLLAARLADLANELGRSVCIGFCDPMGSSGAYHPWRSVLSRIMGLEPLRGSTRLRTQALSFVQEATGATELAPLLNAVLPLELEETATTRQLNGAVRFDNTLRLLVAVLRNAANRYGNQSSPLLILLEDAHWMDGPSWDLVEALRREQIDNLLICATLRFRPLEHASAAHVFDEDETTVIDLSFLSREATQELTLVRLGAVRVTSELDKFVYERTEGNPFFVQELLSAMRELGFLQVVNGEARVIAPATAAIIPDSIAGVLTSRIDRLPERIQLTMKAASVIGQTIDADTLRAVRPGVLDVAEVVAHLEALSAAELLSVVDKGKREYAFRHAITRDVAYAALLSDQRRRLHLAAAEFLETRPEEPAHTRVLFHHFREAGHVVSALRYVDSGGSAAMRQGNYAEAMTFFEFGLGQLEPGDASDSETALSRRSRWTLGLGEAQVAVGKHVAGRSSLEVALADLRFPVPQSIPALVIGVASQLVQQVINRAARRGGRRQSRPTDRRLVAAAEAYEQLGFIYFASGETFLGVHAALRMLNNAEQAASSPALARAYASMSLTVSVTSLRGLALYYERAARRTGGFLGDLPTQAWVEWVAGLRASGVGDWRHVEESCEQALRTSTALGDHRLWVMTAVTLAWAFFMQGKADRANELGAQILELSNQQRNRLWTAWALNGLSETLRMSREDDPTIARCQDTLAILSEQSDRTEEIRASGILASSLYEAGRVEEALVVARRSSDLIAMSDLTACNTLEGFSGVCDVLLGVCEDFRRQKRVLPPTLLKDARRACRALQRYASVFPVGTARSHLTAARLLTLEGREARAERLLRQAVDLGRSLHLTHDKGRALLRLARLSRLNSEERARCIEAGIEATAPIHRAREVERLLSEGHALPPLLTAGTVAKDRL